MTPKDIIENVLHEEYDESSPDLADSIIESLEEEGWRLIHPDAIKQQVAQELGITLLTREDSTDGSVYSTQRS